MAFFAKRMPLHAQATDAHQHVTLIFDRMEVERLQIGEVGDAVFGNLNGEAAVADRNVVGW